MWARGAGCTGAGEPRSGASSSHSTRRLARLQLGIRRPLQSSLSIARNVRASFINSRKYRHADSTVQWESHDAEAWKGFIGTWHQDVTQPAQSKTVMGMRLWKWRDDRRKVLEQMNVHGLEKPGLKQRIDGCFEESFAYKMASKASQQEELRISSASDAPAPPLLVVNPEASAMVSAYIIPSLKKPVKGSALGPTLWGVELFLGDGIDRWSCMAVYNTRSGELVGVNFAQERSVTADPKKPYVLTLASGHLRAPRKSLPADVAEWLPQGTVGSVQRLVPAEDESLVAYEGREEVAWQPPVDASFHNHRLILLPDSMYCFVPATLRPPWVAAPSVAALQLYHLELGGLMHSRALDWLAIQRDAATRRGRCRRRNHCRLFKLLVADS